MPDLLARRSGQDGEAEGEDAGVPVQVHSSEALPL